MMFCLSPLLSCLPFSTGSRVTYANNALRADQLDQLVGDGALAIALGVGLEVAQVTDVAVLISWGTVCLAVGVDLDNC